MSAVSTIIATAAVTVGVLRLAKHLRLKKVDADPALQNAKRKAPHKPDSCVIDADKNPDTGTFEVR